METYFSFSNDKDSREQNILQALMNFQPLIKKYVRELNYDGAETDLIIALIQILDKMPELKQKPLIVSYIARSLRNEYIRLSKKTGLIMKMEGPLDVNLVENKKGVDLDLKIDIQNSLRYLTKKQRRVIELVFFLEYSDAEIARAEKISRQAVFNLKKKAFEYLRHQLK